ncbi:MAG TPA: ABC transporter substrate-binding protein [Burkholderiaceae bacterium]|nr:ABC transporter substrate-binding protein [Burkholderiaceae bacterium]
MNKISQPSKTRERSFRALLAATFAVVATAAFGQGKGETVRIQDYPGTAGLTMRVAIAKGYCENAGIKCQLQVIPSATLGIQAALAKSIEVAFASAETIVPAVMKGAKLKYVGNLYAKSPGEIIVGNHVAAANAGKPFPTWAKDLKGKKIGVTSRGSAVETGMRFILEKAGLTAEDVTWVAVGPPATTIQALAHGQIDFAFSYVPAGAMCEVTKQCKVVWRADTDPQPAEIFATNGAGIGMVLTQAYVDAHPHVVAALVKAARDADEFINDPANSEEVVKISESFFKFNMTDGNQLTRALVKRQIKIAAHDVRISRPAVKATIDFMLQTGQWDKGIDAAEFVDSRAP